ncbi:MAG: T9SS type A sorting domain-containing protein [Bacteroidales bacterium]|nr:T9SS type A sorting domain-containing protein [Bacteroidales bacterium]
MKVIKAICATFAFACAFNLAANAQTLENDNTYASVEETSAVEKTDIVEINVWPKESSFKVMMEIDATEDVKVYNIAGILVKEQKLSKGESLNIETLIPGEYTVTVGTNKKGSFTKK